MKMQTEALAVAAGRWGPFQDEVVGDDGVTRTVERYIPWVDVAAVDGSGSHRATVAQGVETPALFQPMVFEIEVYKAAQDKIKLRYLGAANGHVEAPGASGKAAA